MDTRYRHMLQVIYYLLTLRRWRVQWILDTGMLRAIFIGGSVKLCGLCKGVWKLDIVKTRNHYPFLLTYLAFLVTTLCKWQLHNRERSRWTWTQIKSNWKGLIYWGKTEIAPNNFFRITQKKKKKIM